MTFIKQTITNNNYKISEEESFENIGGERLTVGRKKIKKLYWLIRLQQNNQPIVERT
jgi:hypothetical protein